nr:choice-of-anchor D domain-containing protein [Calditrichia bacterium]
MRRPLKSFVLTFLLLLSGLAAAQPQITVSTTGLPYGPVVLGEDSLRSFTIENTGSDDLAISALEIVGTNAPQFALVNPPVVPFILTPTSPPQNIRVRFAPNRLGALTALVRIVNNDTANDTVTVLLTGQGVVPDIVATPNPLDFGAVLKDSSTTETLTVGNQGTSLLTITHLAIQGDSTGSYSVLAVPLLPLSLNPGETLPLELGFTAPDTGSFPAQLIFVSDDPDQDTLTVQLTARGIKPEIVSTPPALAFGRVTVDTDSQRTISIANTGSASLVIDGIDIVGADQNNFVVVNPPTLPRTIAPGGNPLQLTIRFTPDSLRTHTAFLVVSNNDPDHNPLDIRLTGIGVIPDIAVSPLSLAFGTVVVGQDSVRSVSVSNTGSGVLYIIDLDVVGANPADFQVAGNPTLPIAIAPGGGPVPVSVSFSPQSIGTKTAFFSIVSNDPDENPVFIQLQGVATKPDIVAHPADFDFGNIPVGSQGTREFYVRNDGNATLVIGDTAFVGPGAAHYHMVNPPAFPVEIPVGPDSVKFTVAFQPAAPGRQDAILQLFNNDVDENPVLINLTGVGVVPDISILPNPLDFFTVVVGNPSTKLVSLSNLGGAPLVIGDTAFSGLHAGDFSVSGLPNLPFEIEPEKSIEFSLTFVPDTLGSRQAVFEIFSNDPDTNPYLLNLTGIGTQPGINLVPDSLAFDSVRVGKETELIVQVVNTGTADLSISDTAFTTNDRKAFRLITPLELPLIIPAGSEPLPLAFGFLPDTLGAFGAALEISSNDPNRPLIRLPITGFGTLPDLVLTQDTLDFGDGVINSVTYDTLLLANLGGAPLQIEGLEIGGGDSNHFFNVFPNRFPVSVPAGDTLNAIIGFVPDTLRAYLADVTVFSDDPKAPPTVVMTGVGVVPEIVLGTDSLDFGIVNTSEDSVIYLEITNVGNGRLVISDVIFGGNFPDFFGLDPNLNLPFVVAPDSTTRPFGI